MIYNEDFTAEFKKHVEDFAREKLRSAMEGLAPLEVDLFNRMYKSIDDIPFEKMSWAYAQVMRTLMKRRQ